MKAKSSGIDNRGNVYIDCAECKKGGKGDASCSSGGTIKKIHRGMCFNGELLDKYEPLK